MWLIVILAVLIYVFYSYLNLVNYWKKQDVSYVTPWPLFGNMASVILRQKSSALGIQELYNVFPEKRYVGFFNATVPSLMIRDPDLIKQITVKEFETFPEHRQFIPDGLDPLWSNNLFAMKGGERWQKMRSTLSPAFTSSKLRTMFELMKECSTKFSTYYLKKDGKVEVEMKDAFSRFTNDVIATTVLGVAVDSLENPDNEFYKNGRTITNFRGFQGMKFFLYIIMPTFMKIFRIPIFSKKIDNFFHTLLHDTIKIREKNSIYRPDLINLLIETKKGTVSHDDLKVVDSGFAVVQESSSLKPKAKINLTNDEMKAQMMIFYFAGFDTSSTMMSFAAYELALAPNLQERLRQEVDEGLEKCNGDITYECLLSMKYLDMVVSETLRKWPPFLFNDRVAQKPFTIKPKTPDEKPLVLQAGQVCLIPTYAIQRDPKYFPNPDKFDPERFSDENKHNITPCSFISFGSGPRNCIGSRFALLEEKLILMEIISKFEIVPIAKTPIPMVLSPKDFNPIPEEGFWLGLKPRQKKLEY